MTKERIAELDRLATDAIRECRAYGQPDNPVLGFWKGVKMVVDELKDDMETGRETELRMKELTEIYKTALRDVPAYGARQGENTR